MCEYTHAYLRTQHATAYKYNTWFMLSTQVYKSIEENRQTLNNERIWHSLGNKVLMFFKGDINQRQKR